MTENWLVHKSHMLLTQQFPTFCFVYQDKRSISVVQLAAMIGTICKTTWSMLRRIRTAVGQQNETHRLLDVISFARLSKGDNHSTP